MAANLRLDRHAMKDPATSHLRVFVGGLAERVTVDDLVDLFSQFGQVNGAFITRSFGFVQFELESQAKDAISKADGMVIHGKAINVKPSTPSDKPRVDQGTVKPDIPLGTAGSLAMSNEDGNEDQYDSYGNFVEKNYGEEDYEDREGFNISWEGRGGARGRGARGRGVRGRGRGAGYRERSPVVSRGGDTRAYDRGSYDRYHEPADYSRPVLVTERNDCEIIVVSKALTEYAEYIEGRLKRLGIVVDLLFPMEDVPIGKVLGNIASRGCLYAILVMPQNQEHRSLTLTILHGLPQEHRNMPIEDALHLISRNYQEVRRGGSSGREAVYALLGQLADGRTLTVLQYDKVMEYLQERKEQQVKIELGEPLNPAPASKTHVELQQRILSILNDKTAPPEPPPPQPVAPPTQQSKLLSDPSVRKALDSILQKFT